YFQRHAFANTELGDLLKDLEDTSGRDLGSWSKEWLQTSGVNTLRPLFTTDEDGAFTSFVVEQSHHPNFPTLRRHRVGVGLYDLLDGRLVRRPSIEIDVVGAETDVPKLIGERQPDLVLLNDGDLTYAKVRLDARSLATAVANIGNFDESLPRALVWGACWDMTRDGEMRTQDWVELVLRGLRHESDLMAVRALVAQTRRAVSTYGAPEHRDVVAARWESGLLELARTADAGSDLQLAFVRALAEVARSDESLTLLRGLLAGSESLDGLVVDTDLRWMLLTGLCRAGQADDAMVDVELEHDNTISGKESAAAARAAMPTAEAKERAWEQALSAETPNETMRYIAIAFQQPGQAEVLAPFVDRYLDAATTLWEDRGVFHASTVLTFMFPKELATEQTRERVARWLETSTANPAARRFVSEGLDEIERALRAQACDAAVS
ncbi:MAG: M1 family metallopeptidase, partial [Nocardioidaceae bacterium]